uniref:ETS-related transcription factor Elf-3 n=1 Tax=Amazona collaria TaxID=241587 RepID=A0A8B9GDZ5_9PSIT
MAGSCELSNILSNYISAMYQPDEMQPTLDMLGHLGDDSTLGLSLPTNKPEWFSELPYFWTKVQVLEWISYHVEKNKYDASSIDFSCCNMDGHALCHCTRDQMRLIFGPLGDELYDRLHEISESSDELNWIIDLLEKEDATSKEPFLDAPSMVAQNEGGMGLGGMGVPSHGDGFLGLNSVCSPSALPCASSPEERTSLCPLRDVTFPFSVRADGFAGSKKGDSKHGKRKRGRPRKLSKESRDCLQSRKSKHAPRGTHLWEFIRDILIHPELNEGLMKWEDRQEGIFKFLRSEAVAQLWGQKKKNSSMTYEKLSRAMRYYYKREILERVDGRRLVYKFGKNSSGWKEEEVLNRSKEL